MSDTCLSCGLQLDTGDHLYHRSCKERLFLSQDIPHFPFALDELDHLAGKIVESHNAAVTGVQKKLSLHMSQEGDHKKLTFIGLWGNWILKPPVQAYPQLPENEMLTLNLAHALGIESVPHGLIQLASGEYAFITRRIDRQGNEKLPMEDLCQISQRMTEDKYRGSLEQAGKLVAKYCQNRMLDVLRFYELVLFCFLSGNGDMHWKNFSLTGIPPEVRLAPAYDLLNTRLLISEKEDPEESALAINGKRRKLKLEDFHSLGVHLGLTRKQMDNVALRFSKKLDLVLSMMDRSFLVPEAQGQYKDIWMERWARLFYE